VIKKKNLKIKLLKRFLKINRRLQEKSRLARTRVQAASPIMTNKHPRRKMIKSRKKNRLPWSCHKNH
jgi:hypothetical protein